MDSLWWATALGALSLCATTYGLSTWVLVRPSLRRPGHAGASFGPVPGYAQYPGEAVHEIKAGLDGSGLEVASLEAFHALGRERLVLSVRWASGVEGGEGGEGGELLSVVMFRAARQVMDITGVDAVVLEMPGDVDGLSFSEAPCWMVSRDGGGWSGTGRDVREVMLNQS